MYSGKPQPILSAIANVYFLAMALGAVVALGARITSQPPPLLFSFLLFSLVLLTSILYQALVADRVSWNSPGECMCGRRSVDGRKFWTNPYRRNRWALFLVLFVPLTNAGNSWDNLYTGELFPLAQIAFKVLLLLILSLSIVGIGAGQARGSWMILLYYIILAGGAIVLSEGHDDTVLRSFARSSAVFYVAMGVITVLIVRFYDRRRRRLEAAARGETV